MWGKYNREKERGISTICKKFAPEHPENAFQGSPSTLYLSYFRWHGILWLGAPPLRLASVPNPDPPSSYFLKTMSLTMASRIVHSSRTSICARGGALSHASRLQSKIPATRRVRGLASSAHGQESNSDTAWIVRSNPFLFYRPAL